MLTINNEFSRGILFVRLTGELTYKTINKLEKEVTNMVKDMEISNVVFNISNLSKIDICGINAILTNYDICKKNRGISLLCCNDESIIRNEIKNSPLENYMYDASDEMSAMKMIKI